MQITLPSSIFSSMPRRRQTSNRLLRRFLHRCISLLINRCLPLALTNFAAPCSRIVREDSMIALRLQAVAMLFAGVFVTLLLSIHSLPSP